MAQSACIYKFGGTLLCSVTLAVFYFKFNFAKLKYLEILNKSAKDLGYI
jgi:hypothetical protein